MIVIITQWQCLLINYDGEDLEDNLNAEFHNVADLTDMSVKTIDEFVQLSADHEIVVIINEVCGIALFHLLRISKK